MKLLFIIEAWEPIYGGGQVHVIELAKRLIEKHNCTIDLYTRKLKIGGKSYKHNESLYNGKLKIIRCGITSKYSRFAAFGEWSYQVDHLHPGFK